MNKKTKWIPVAEAEALLNMSTLRVIIWQKREDVSKWYKNETNKKGAGYINIGYLESIWERRRRIQFECHDFYYELLEKFNKNSNMIDSFFEYSGIPKGTITKFFSHLLWNNTYFIDLSVMGISTTLIKFHRFASEILCDWELSGAEEIDYNEAKKLSSF